MAQTEILFRLGQSMRLIDTSYVFLWVFADKHRLQTSFLYRKMLKWTITSHTSILNFCTAPSMPQLLSLFLQLLLNCKLWLKVFSKSFVQFVSRGSLDILVSFWLRRCCRNQSRFVRVFCMIDCVVKNKVRRSSLIRTSSEKWLKNCKERPTIKQCDSQ